MRTAETFDFDYVSVISDPAREAADCGAALEWFDDQPPAIDPAKPRIADPSDLATLDMPDPHGGGRMTDRVQGVAALKDAVGTVDGLQKESEAAQAAFARGESVDLHDVLIKVEEAEIGTVAYERVLGHHRGAGQSALAHGFVAVLEEVAEHYQLELMNIHGSTLKKHATDCGTADKADVILAAWERWRSSRNLWVFVAQKNGAEHWPDYVRRGKVPSDDQVDAVLAVQICRRHRPGLVANSVVRGAAKRAVAVVPQDGHVVGVLVRYG